MMTYKVVEETAFFFQRYDPSRYALDMSSVKGIIKFDIGFEIARFLWNIHLILSNLVGQFLSFSFDFNFPESLYKLVVNAILHILGFENGYISGGLLGVFLPLIFIILGAYITYKGVYQRKVSVVIDALKNFVLVLFVSLALLLGGERYIQIINGVNNTMSSVVTQIGINIMNDSNNTFDNRQAGLYMQDMLFNLQVKTPWLLLNFGTTDLEEARYLSFLEQKVGSDERKDLVKQEVENNENEVMDSKSNQMWRTGNVLCCLLANGVVNYFVVVLSGIMLVFRTLFLFCLFVLPFFVFLALLPNNVKVLGKFLNYLFEIFISMSMMSFLITICFVITYLILEVGQTEGYPYFIMVFLTIIVFYGESKVRDKIISMMGFSGYSKTMRSLSGVVGSGKRSVQSFSSNAKRNIDNAKKKLKDKKAKQEKQEKTNSNKPTKSTSDEVKENKNIGIERSAASTEKQEKANSNKPTQSTSEEAREHKNIGVERSVASTGEKQEKVNANKSTQSTSEEAREHKNIEVERDKYSKKGVNTLQVERDKYSNKDMQNEDYQLSKGEPIVVNGKQYASSLAYEKEQNSNKKIKLNRKNKRKEVGSEPTGKVKEPTKK